MSTVNATDGRKNFFELINRASNQERIAIRQSRRYANERHGKPIAALVSYEDLAKLEALEDAIATAQLKQAMVQSTGFVTAVELLAMRSTDG